MILSVLLYLPEYPCKTSGSRHGAYTYDPIILFFTCPNTPVWGWALQGSSSAGHSGFSERCVGRPGRDWASKSGLVQNLTTPYRRWESKRMHKQGEKLERRKVVLDAEGFRKTGASLIVKRILGFVACVCFRAHMRASMCDHIRSCVHVHFCVQMRVLPSTCARKHL